MGASVGRRGLARVVIVVVTFALGLLGLAVSAQGAPYVLQPTLSVSTQTPAQGATLTVAGAGYVDCGAVSLTIGSATLGTATPDGSGAFSVAVALPSGLTGAQTIVGSCTGASASAAITISATKAGSLSNTGAAVIGISGVGVLLLFIGAALVLITRRRRATS